MTDIQADSPDIPVVDLAALTGDNACARGLAVDAIHRGYGEFGLVYIRNHGVDLAQRDRVYQGFRALCDADGDTKASLTLADKWFQRGMTPPNTEKAVVAGGQPDFKECYFAAPLPLDPLAQRQYPEIYAENIWPAGPVGDAYRDDYMALGQSIHQVGLALLRGCAIALDLPEDTFVAYTQGGAHVSRALKYLPVTDAQVDGGILWGEEHTDFNLLTLLPGGKFWDPQGQPAPRPDASAGLYLRTRQSPSYPTGRQLHPTPPADCIVSQVGQQLEILTGGTFVATPHIVKPPRAQGWTRTAFAHFIHVHAHRTLFPLPKFQDDQAIAAYSPPVLAGTYGLKTLVDIGLAPPDKLRSLGYRHYDRLASMRASEPAGHDDTPDSAPEDARC